MEADSPSPFRTVAVLGGGVTGLAAAYRLSRLGHRVRLFEATNRLGGSVRTEMHGEWLVEGGPNSLQLSQAPVAALFRELQIEHEIIPAAAAARNRYLVHQGRPVAAPLSPGSFFGSPLFSAGTKFRLLGELFRRPRRRDSDVSLADLVRQHFGEELLVRAVQPLISGIFAGDPERLSTRHAFPQIWEIEQHHGSIIRGQIAAARRRRDDPSVPKSRIVSFPRGLQTIVHALVTQLPADTIVLPAEIHRLQRLPAGWQVCWKDGATDRSELFDAVICALPAARLAELEIGTERPFAPLAEIVQPPVVSLFLGYRREQVGHPLDGFGALVPAREKRSVLGILFSSTLFPGRAPPGHVALTVLAGGCLQPEVAQLPPEAFMRRAQADLRDLLQVEGEPVFQQRTFWPRAIPQYDLGYERHLERLEAIEAAHPGIVVAGQVRDGIALGACLTSGLDRAEQVSRVRA